MLLFLNSRIKIGLLLLIGALTIVLPSCQDDPILTPVNDGIPVFTTKTKASITSIRLDTYPSTDPNGDLWDVVDSSNNDFDGLPDIFFNITDPSPQPPVLWSQLSHFSDVRAFDSTSFILLTPYEVIPFGSNIDVNIYDYELPDSTLMGTVNFLIGQYPDPTNPYPESVTSVENGYSVTIGIRWEE